MCQASVTNSHSRVMSMFSSRTITRDRREAYAAEQGLLGHQ